MTAAWRNFSVPFLFLIFGFLVYGQGLSVQGVAYRDDEIFYFRSTQEMLQQGNYLSPTYFGEARFQKPILFYWFIVLAYKIFGVGWVAARAVSVCFAGLSVWLTWKIAAAMFNRRVAALASILLMSFSLFFRHAQNAVPDMALNFFIVLALWSFYQIEQHTDKRFYHYLFFAACGLGFMVKGFAALVIPGVTLLVYLLTVKRASVLTRIHWLSGLTILALIILPWFWYMHQRHGDAYTQYMIIQETKNRALAPDNAPVLVELVRTIIHNTGFYFQVVMTYFAPWSVLMLGAVPWAMRRQSFTAPETRGTWFLLIWFWVVFIFFTLIKVKINHYLLVLSTPLAILVSLFLNSPAVTDRRLAQGLRIFFVALFMAGLLGWSLLHVVLAGGHPVWLLLYTIAGVATVRVVLLPRSLATAAAGLGIFMLAVMSQSAIIAASGVSSHTTLRRMAEVIRQRPALERESAVISVGSHDIHEKEWQVYFDDYKIEKAGADFDPLTDFNLKKLVRLPSPLYCLILPRDYERNRDEFEYYKLKIIAEDYVFRKRFYPDRGLFTALVRLDRPRIKDYFMEKVILLYKSKYEPL